MRALARAAGATLALALGWPLLAPAMAAELDWSGFIRLGYARADQSALYEAITGGQRDWRRDTIAGAQLDARLAPRWSAVLQVTLAPPGQDNRPGRGTLALAALSYRPDNALTLRAGRLRVPLLLNSENTGVGGAYSMARLPDAVYALTANTDYAGAAASREWELGLGELTLDAYAGRARVPVRYLPAGSGMGRDATPLAYRAGADAGGAALTLRRDADLYRIGLHHVALDDGPWAALDAAAASSLAGAGARVATASAVHGLGLDWRVSAELLHQQGGGLRRDERSSAGYLSLERQRGAWTPYLTLARLVARASVPRLTSAALGVAFDAGAGAAWKGEWQHVRCHLAGDADSGAALQPDCLAVWSLSYTRTF